MDDPDVRFMNLPAAKFPFTVFAFPESSTRDEELLWVRHVSGPGAISIPALGATGQRVRVVIHYGDGTVARVG